MVGSLGPGFPFLQEPRGDLKENNRKQKATPLRRLCLIFFVGVLGHLRIFMEIVS